MEFPSEANSDRILTLQPLSLSESHLSPLIFRPLLDALSVAPRSNLGKFSPRTVRPGTIRDLTFLLVPSFELSSAKATNVHSTAVHSAVHSSNNSASAKKRTRARRLLYSAARIRSLEVAIFVEVMNM